jgi:hypothetical protein
VAKALAKELKQPDEFVSFWTHLGAKLAKHRWKVIATVASAGVALAAGWGVVSYRNAQAAKATVAFARIDRIASAELLPEKPEDKAAKPEKTEDDRCRASRPSKNVSRPPTRRPTPSSHLRQRRARAQGALWQGQPLARAGQGR